MPSSFFLSDLFLFFSFILIFEDNDVLLSKLWRDKDSNGHFDFGSYNSLLGLKERRHVSLWFIILNLEVSDGPGGHL
jgi:hypothetical protein